MSTQPSEEARVLLVGGDEPERKAWALALDACGYLVESAANADAARGLLERQSFDAVLVDLDTTGLAGARLAEHARVHSQEPAVLLLSRDSASAAATEAGAPKCLQKPVEPRALVRATVEVMRLRQVEQANRRALGADGAARVRQERAERVPRGPRPRSRASRVRCRRSWSARRRSSSPWIGRGASSSSTR